MKTYYQNSRNQGIKNAQLMQSIFEGKLSADVHLTACPCLKTKAMIMSQSEITEQMTQTFIRNLMDCDQIISTYVHNRLIKRTQDSTFIFIGNYLETYKHIYGILLLPD